MRKVDKLRVYWSKKEDGVMLQHPMGDQTPHDSHYLMGVFTKDFIQELSNRGYDLTTMAFSVEPRKGHLRFAATRYSENGCNHGDYSGERFERDGKKWMRCPGCKDEVCLEPDEAKNETGT